MNIFTRLHLDRYHGSWNSYQTKTPTKSSSPQLKNIRFSYAQALQLSPVETRATKMFRGEEFEGGKSTTSWTTVRGSATSNVTGRTSSARRRSASIGEDDRKVLSLVLVKYGVA